MLRKSTLVVFLLSICLSLSAHAHGTTAYENGRWWDGERFVVRTVYAVDGSLTYSPPTAVDRTIDLDGGWVVPPLADAHDHGLAAPDFDAESRRYLAQGVFYVQNPNSMRTFTLEAREQAARPETVDVTYSMGGLTSTGGWPVPIYERAAAHMEGWTVERMAGEAYFEVDDAAGLDAAWASLLAAEPDLVKVYLETSEEHAARAGDPAFHGRRGLDPALLPAVVERARAAGLRVATHVTSAADFRTAVAAGVDEIAHLPLERLDAAAAEAAAAAGVVVVTTTISHRPTGGVDVEAVHRHNLALLLEHGVSLVLGTDSERPVLDEAENLVRLGVDPGTVFRLATRDTARWIFPGREIGHLGEGAEASFLVLAADPGADLAAFRDLRAAVKQGHALDLAAVETPGVGQRLAHALMAGGAAAALAELDRLLAEEPERWDFGEAQLNALGYAALEHGRAADAVGIFA
ncbi:MAG TPA: amidohydrolase family protein, partial [Thermoanaerobaculia bacterium]|nr:amidohydrolase family protein [Thermoanaerobaculia bacterium]